MTPTPLSSIIRHGCAAVLVACVFLLVFMAAFKVAVAPIGLLVGVGTVAAIIGARQPV